MTDALTIAKILITVAAVLAISIWIANKVNPPYCSLKDLDSVVVRLGERDNAYLMDRKGGEGYYSQAREYIFDGYDSLEIKWKK